MRRVALTSSRSPVHEAAAFVRAHLSRPPRVGLILGSGLDTVESEIEAECALPYRKIPHFPVSTALGHKGRLLCGLFDRTPVAVMQGRIHQYEGYSPDEVSFPVRVMCELGCELLIVTNASGGLNPRLARGDILVVADHINLQWGTPSVALSARLPGRAERVERFPYSVALVQQALEIARGESIRASRGVYAAVTGPNYETRAELRFLRRIGADAVGMSTVPEVLAAAECGMSVLGLSTITNVCRPDAPSRVAGEEVLASAMQVAPNVARLVRGVLAEGAGERPH